MMMRKSKRAFRTAAADRAVYVLIILYFACSAAIATVYNRLPYTDGLRVFAYQVFFQLLPGLALLRIVSYPSKNQIETVGIGYIAGYCLSILSYLAAIPLRYVTDNWMSYIAYFQYALAGIGLICLLWPHGYNPHRLRSVRWKSVSAPELKFFAVILIFVYLLCFLTYGLLNRLPGGNSEQGYYGDILYWLNMAASLFRGFPPESLRATGYMFHYHYFSCIQLAVVEKTVGVNSVSFGIAYSYIQGVMFLVFGFYPLFSEVLRKKWLVALAMLLRIFSEGNYQQTTIFYVSHMISAPFGFDIGMGLAGAAVLQLIRIERSGSAEKGQVIVFLLLQFICMGAKAPVCLILLGFEGLLCLSWLIRRRHIARTFVLGFVSIALCAFVYVTFMSGSWASWQVINPAASANVPTEEADIDTNANTGTNTNRFLLSWKATSSYAPVLREWYQDANQKLFFPLKIFLALFLMFKFFFYSHMAVSFLCILCVIQMFRYRKQTEALQWCLAGISLAGLMMTLFLSFSGYSQAYFIMSASSYMILLAFYRPRDIPSAHPGFLRLKWIIALMLSFLCVFNAAGFTFLLFRDAVQILSTGKIENLASMYSSSLIANTVTPLEEAGYDWIQKNTEEDAILVSNAILRESGIPVRKGTVFTRRRFYLESFVSSAVGVEERDVRAAQITRYFQGDPEGRQAMLDNGVDYVIYLTRIRDGYDAVKNLECVYENNDIRIYKLA